MERSDRFDETDLYVVITESQCGGRSALEVLEAVLDGGVRLVQLREKDRSGHDLYDLACEFRRRTASRNALLIINDRVDVALASQADGVHLGQDDLPLASARTLAPDLIIGVSTHTLEQALAAQTDGADYVNIGPIFPTQTKTTAVDPLGCDAVGAISPRLSIPFSCMGGIKLHNINEILEQGARHPAVVTAVTAAGNIQDATEQLRERVLAYR